MAANINLVERPTTQAIRARKYESGGCRLDVDTPRFREAARYKLSVPVKAISVLPDSQCDCNWVTD